MKDGAGGRNGGSTQSFPVVIFFCSATWLREGEATAGCGGRGLDVRERMREGRLPDAIFKETREREAGALATSQRIFDYSDKAIGHFTQGFHHAIGLPGGGGSERDLFVSASL